MTRYTAPWVVRLDVRILAGPRLYYSLFGAPGLVLGSRARLSRRAIEVAVEAPGVLYPFRLRLRTTDVALCREILLNGQYDSELLRVPQVIVDAGANIGLAAIFYANRYPSARIIAIEPERSNYEALAKNAAPYPNIFPIRAALWKENKEINILNPGMAHTTFQIESQREQLGSASWGAAPGITLDKLMADVGIDYVDLLKVDIEGAEKDVFQNSGAWISRVGVIAIELHDWLQPGSTEAVRQAARDFEVEWTKGETTYLARAGHVREDGAPSRAATERSHSAPHHVPHKFPLKILAY